MGRLDTPRGREFLQCSAPSRKSKIIRSGCNVNWQIWQMANILSLFFSVEFWEDNSLCPEQKQGSGTSSSTDLLRMFQRGCEEFMDYNELTEGAYFLICTSTSPVDTCRSIPHSQTGEYWATHSFPWIGLVLHEIMLHNDYFLGPYCMSSSMMSNYVLVTPLFVLHTSIHCLC
jgi:hypothetical protein